MYSFDLKSVIYYNLKCTFSKYLDRQLKSLQALAMKLLKQMVPGCEPFAFIYLYTHIYMCVCMYVYLIIHIPDWILEVKLISNKLRL